MTHVATNNQRHTWSPSTNDISGTNKLTKHLVAINQRHTWSSSITGTPRHHQPTTQPVTIIQRHLVTINQRRPCRNQTKTHLVAINNSTTLPVAFNHATTHLLVAIKPVEPDHHQQTIHPVAINQQDTWSQSNNNTPGCYHYTTPLSFISQWQLVAINHITTHLGAINHAKTHLAPSTNDTTSRHQ